MNSVQQYLDMKVMWNLIKKTLSLSQAVYTKKMLIKYNMKNCCVISMSMKQILSNFTKSTEASDNNIIDWYALTIESLI